MYIIHFSQDEFLAYLKDHGWKPVNNDYWNEYDRVMIGNEDGSTTFPLQMQPQYYPPIVVKICDQIEIPPPADMLKIVNQLRSQKK